MVIIEEVKDNIAKVTISVQMGNKVVEKSLYLELWISPNLNRYALTQQSHEQLLNKVNNSTLNEIVQKLKEYPINM